MPSSVCEQRLSGFRVTSAPQTAWLNPPSTYGASASSEACPPGPWPQSCPSAIASVSGTFNPSAQLTDRPTWVTSSAWVSRVRW